MVKVRISVLSVPHDRSIVRGRVRIAASFSLTVGLSMRPDLSKTELGLLESLTGPPWARTFVGSPFCL